MNAKVEEKRGSMDGPPWMTVFGDDSFYKPLNP